MGEGNESYADIYGGPEQSQQVADNSIFSQIIGAGGDFLSKRLDFEIAKENAKNRAGVYLPRGGVGLGQGAQFQALPGLGMNGIVMIALIVGGFMLLKKA